MNKYFIFNKLQGWYGSSDVFLDEIHIVEFGLLFCFEIIIIEYFPCLMSNQNQHYEALALLISIISMLLLSKYHKCFTSYAN